MTRQFHHSRIRKNHLGIHKDPHAAFIAGVDLRASADATWARRNGSNDAADWAEACDELEKVFNEAPIKASEPSLELYTAGELKGMTFPPLQFAIPGYLVEGLTVLVGKPKRGKRLDGSRLGVGHRSRRLCIRLNPM
jgi:hypothetical protein